MTKFPLEYHDGGQVDVFPTRILLHKPLSCRVEWPEGEGDYPDFPLSLDEYSLTLAMYFLEKYFDRSLLPLYRDMRYESDTFDYYEDNIYHYSTVLCMLDDIRNVAQDIQSGKDTDCIKDIRSRCNHFPLNRNELDQWFDENRHNIADYLLRFCAAVKTVMDNAPDYEFLCFEGP